MEYLLVSKSECALNSKRIQISGTVMQIVIAISFVSYGDFRPL